MSSVGSAAFISFAYLTLLALGCTVALHILAWVDTGVSIGVFRNRTDYQWKSTSLPLVDFDWLLYIWAAVYAYQLVWVVFSLTLVCRRGRYGHLYTNPPIFSVDIYVLFIIALCGTVAGLFLWDERYVIYTLMANLVTTVFLYLALLVSFRGMKDHGMELIVAKNVSHLWDIVVLLQNGLAAHASWQTVNMMFIAAAALSSTSGVLTPDVASYGLQGALMLYTLAFFAVDTFFSRVLNGYLLTPYLVSILAFALIAVHNAPLNNYHYIVAASLSGIAAVMFLIKLGVIIKRHRKRASDKRSGLPWRPPGALGSKRTSTGTMYFPGFDTASSHGGYDNEYMYADEGTILKD